MKRLGILTAAADVNSMIIMVANVPSTQDTLSELSEILTRYINFYVFNKNNHCKGRLDLL